ncbi:uncharacterized protein LOC114362246 isoform X2 [Ostrinia furnacalis]|uniref:uncharacterized protein LOC114362246 isoform X2 n=1 Tax=Ostrinia furnacalis TaxID=93504 RepID=UPI00103F1E6A|nr:uncharacterized protein LOC114362246 isoform X2 [Ostrinia furnacalis]
MTYPNQPPPPQFLGSSNTVFITETRFDPSYLKTPPGIIKSIILFNLIAFICIQASAFWSNGRGVFFNTVAAVGFIFSGALLALYVFHVVEKYHNLKWLKIELVGNVVLVFLFLIASTIVVAFGSAAYSAAGFFGYLSMVLYGLEAFLKVRALQAGDLAQGSRVGAAAPHVLTPPALP